MLCSGCGSTIPFSGEVCPRCHRNKSSDQVGTVFGVLAMIGGGWIGSLVGGVVGAIIGGIGSAIVVAIIIALSSNNSAKEPPVVQIAPSKPSVVTKATSSDRRDDTATRLRRLDQLKADGLVTDAEYRAQRRTIIGAI